MPLRTLVIVNPRSRNGATGRRWGSVERKLRAALGPFEVERTAARRDAERIAREAARAGIERLVVAGGDGTVSEVATGLLAADLGGCVQLGLLPLGTGGDFLRTLGVPRDLGAAIGVITAGRTRRLDAGRVSYQDDSSGPTTVYFLNVASLGVSGLIVELVDRGTKLAGSGLAYLVGTLRGIARYRPAPVSIKVDGELIHSGPVVLATAANGQYFGGGMRVAPDARSDDGLLDVVVIAGLGKAGLVRRLPGLYRGNHIHDAAVKHRRGKVIEVDAAPGAVRLEIDGEPLGTLPARFEILPGALSLLGPGS